MDIIQGLQSVQQHLDRIVEATVPSVIKAFEERIQKLESDKLLIEEKLAKTGQPIRAFDEMYRTALRYLENPFHIWELGRFEDKRAVLKLTFSDRLVYERGKGYRTPKLSLPFKVLEHASIRQIGMVPPLGIEPSSAVYKTAASPQCFGGLAGADYTRGVVISRAGITVWGRPRCAGPAVADPDSPGVRRPVARAPCRARRTRFPAAPCGAPRSAGSASAP